MGEQRYVYKLTFPDGMVYFGSTSNIKHRWRNNGSSYSGMIVGEWIKRFGWENVKKEIVLYLKAHSGVACEVERALVEENSSISLNVNYNKWNNGKRKSGSDFFKNRKILTRHVWDICGIKKTASEWCKLYGVGTGSAINRCAKYGMTPLESLNAPPVPRTMAKNPIAFWDSIGYARGKDKNSFVVKREDWPEIFQTHEESRAETIAYLESNAVMN